MTDYIIDLFQRWGHLSVASGSALGLFFILAALVVFPRTILIVAAGASFGIGAAPIILVAGTAGGTLAFLLSRYIASDWFQRKLKQHPSLEAIAEAVDDEGWRIIALTRLGAPVPSALQNYLYGLTESICPLSFCDPGVQQPASLPVHVPRRYRENPLDEKPPGFTIVSILVTVVIIALIAWRVRKLLSAK